MLKSKNILSIVYINRMFKDIRSGFAKFFTVQRTIILIVFLVVAYVLYSYASSKTGVIDRMTNGGSVGSSTASSSTSAPAEVYSESVIENLAQNRGYTAKPVADPNDLLPKDSNSQWGELNTLNQGNIVMPDLLQAGYHIGLDTIGQTLRNANLQERSDPIIQKQDVGPWYQSTIEPDFGRVPLEVGYGPR
jgi:hypothetical protein